MTEKEHMLQTCSRLEIAIQAIGIPQADICREMNVSPSRLSNWLSGRHYPNPFFLTQFCNRYGVTMDWIYREQVAGVVVPLAGALWAAAKASQSAQVVEERPEPARGRKRKGDATRAQNTRT